MLQTANEPDAMVLRKLGLMPHQVYFAREFFKLNAQPYYVYVTSHGSEKMDLSSALCSYMLDYMEARKVLIIVPDNLCHIWRSTLARKLENNRVTLIDMPGYQKIKETVSAGKNPWPESIVAVLSMDTFRDEEIFKTLRQTEWDFSLVGEAQGFRGKKSELLARLIKCRIMKRMLLITTSKQEALLSLFPPDMFKTEWDLFVD